MALGHGVSSGDLWKMEYEYGELQTNGTVDTTKNTGNIARQTLSFNGLAQPFVQSYKYDSLYRLTEAKETQNATQTWKQNFIYDRYGNRTGHEKFIGSVESIQTNVTHPTIDVNNNRFNAAQGFTYDKNGNLITDATDSGRSFVFNGDNKQKEVRDANNNLIGQYFFDGEGKRIKKLTYDNGVLNETTVFVYSSGKLIAEYSTAAPPPAPTTKWTVTDQLGSPRILVDSLGQVVSRRDFMPFGEEVFPDGTHRKTVDKYTFGDNVRQKFTGYQKDEETQLDFAEARMYESRHGRFTAVDPLLASGKSANPQTFNRYVYVTNNPLQYTDPDGQQMAAVPNGRWYRPETPDGVQTYRFESTQPEGYVPVTERNRRGDLVGDFTGSYIGTYHEWVLKFDERGPLKAAQVIDVRSNTTYAYRLTDEERLGYSFIRPDDRRVPAIAQNAIEPIDVALLLSPLKTSGIGIGSGTSGLIKNGAKETAEIGARNGGYNLALGMADNLNDFAKATKSTTYVERFGPAFTESNFKRLATEASEINFNMGSGFSVTRYSNWQKAGRPDGFDMITNYELDTVLSNPELRRKTNFFMFPTQ